MAKRKTEFELKWAVTGNPIPKSSIQIQTKIENQKEVRVLIVHEHQLLLLNGKDLETFALNILKALKSKHLKQ